MEGATYSDEQKMAGKLNGIACIEKLAQKGKWGDEDAIKALQLESVVKSPSFKEMDRSTLSTCLTVGGKAKAAGKKMGLTCLEQSATT